MKDIKNYWLSRIEVKKEIAKQIKKPTWGNGCIAITPGPKFIPPIYKKP